MDGRLRDRYDLARPPDVYRPILSGPILSGPILSEAVRLKQLLEELQILGGLLDAPLGV